jgi:hypothetical protein
MIEYTAGIIGDQVVFTLNAINDPSLEDYQSEDGFLTLRKVAGGSDGWLGYGGLCVYYCPDCLPIALESPHYEHAQDLNDTLERITRNMEILNGYVLP